MKSFGIILLLILSFNTFAGEDYLNHQETKDFKLENNIAGNCSPFISLRRNDFGGLLIYVDQFKTNNQVLQYWFKEGVKVDKNSLKIKVKGFELNAENGQATLVTSDKDVQTKNCVYSEILEENE